MRLVCGFFAHLSKFQPDHHPAAFQIDLGKRSSWFFLRKQQMLLFLQDPMHLVTKWRNRLFSGIADMQLEKKTIDINYLHNIIESDQHTKLDHGLTVSDLNPKDRQNYRSCVKLVSDNLLNILNENANAQSTHVYLKLLKMILIAYVEKSTPIIKRECIYHS